MSITWVECDQEQQIPAWQRGAVRDFVTVLETHGPLATKQISRSPNGCYETKAFGNARMYRMWALGLHNIDDVKDLLDDLQNSCRRFIVRGEIIPGTYVKNAVRRHIERETEPATLRPTSHHIIALDIDHISCPEYIDPIEDLDEIIEYVVSLLPSEFHDATCICQFTSSHGIKPGISCRLWFWSDRKLSDDELKTWLANAPVDHSLFQPSQPHYTAAPIFSNGAADPLSGRRCILWRGDRDEITPPRIARRKRAMVRSNGSGSGLAEGTAGGYAAHRAAIGDHAGGGGFFRPIKAAVAAWYRAHGSQADPADLQTDLTEAIRAAVADPTRHSSDYIKLRVRDLDTLIPAIAELQLADESAKEAERTFEPATGGIVDARAAIRAEISAFAGSVIDGEFGLDFNRAPSQRFATWPLMLVLKAPPGSGKTRIMLETLAVNAVRHGRSITIAVPRHELGEQLARDLAKLQITARVYRSRDASNSNGELMCVETERTEAIGLALGEIDPLACKNPKGICDHYEICHYQRQKLAPPQIWIVPTNCIFGKIPSFIPEPDILVIDEAFYNASFKKDVTVDLDWLVQNRIDTRAFPPGREGHHPDNLRLVQLSEKLYNSLRGAESWQKLRASFFEDVITAEEAREAWALEWRRLMPNDDIAPGMPKAVVLARTKARIRNNQEVYALTRLWEAIADILHNRPGHLVIYNSKALLPMSEHRGPALIIKSRAMVHKSWRCPTLHLDGTASALIVKAFFPQAIFCKIEVEVPAPPAVHIVKIWDKSMSKSNLIPTEGGSDKDNTGRENLQDGVRELIEVVAYATPGRVGIITFVACENALRERGLPENAEVAHYNNLTGLNALENVSILIQIGRNEAPPHEVEEKAELIWGIAVESVINYYEKVYCGISVRGQETGVAALNYRHPNPYAEELRRVLCVGEHLQAFFRARPFDRTPERPLIVIDLCNVATPVPADAVMTWEEMRPTLADRMLAREGAIPTNHSDMAAAFPDLFPSADAARKAISRESGRRGLLGVCPVLDQHGKVSQNSAAEGDKPSKPALIPDRLLIRYLPLGVCPVLAVRTYCRPAATRGRTATLIYDPERLSDPQAWLAAKLGSGFNIIE